MQLPSGASRVAIAPLEAEGSAGHGPSPLLGPVTRAAPPAVALEESPLTPHPQCGQHGTRVSFKEDPLSEGRQVTNPSRACPSPCPVTKALKIRLSSKLQGEAMDSRRTGRERPLLALGPAVP